MNSRRFYILILITAIILLVAVSLSANAEYSVKNVTSCQTINESGNYVLTRDIISVNKTCFTISASNVTLDGNGYSIVARQGSTSSGVKVISSNVEIRNIGIRNFAWAIDAQGTIQTKIYGNTISGGKGINAGNSLDMEVISNELSGSSVGINMGRSNSSIVAFNHLLENNQTIKANEGHGNRIEGNIIDTGAKSVMASGEDNIVRDNEFVNSS